MPVVTGNREQSADTSQLVPLSGPVDYSSSWPTSAASSSCKTLIGGNGACCHCSAALLPCAGDQHVVAGAGCLAGGSFICRRLRGAEAAGVGAAQCGVYARVQLAEAGQECLGRHVSGITHDDTWVM
jgi:hypothetical protein